MPVVRLELNVITLERYVALRLATGLPFAGEGTLQTSVLNVPRMRIYLDGVRTKALRFPKGI